MALVEAPEPGEPLCPMSYRVAWAVTPLLGRLTPFEQDYRRPETVGLGDYPTLLPSAVRYMERSRMPSRSELRLAEAHDALVLSAFVSERWINHPKPRKM